MTAGRLISYEVFTCVPRPNERVRAAQARDVSRRAGGGAAGAASARHLTATLATASRAHLLAVSYTNNTAWVHGSVCPAFSLQM